jgi:hypothetical protein
VFAKQGHSGGSAQLTLDAFNEVARYKTLTPLKNPMDTGEFMEVGLAVEGCSVLQSTRKSTVFSRDGGKTWYDLDGKIPWWKRWFVHRAYITFGGV